MPKENSLEEKSRLKGVVIGAGVQGARHARTIASNERVELVGVVDACLDTARSVAESVSTPAGEVAYAEGIATIPKAFDFVVIATPPGTHYNIARDMLLLGKHVLVEKPLTLDIMEADELFMHAQYAYQCGGLVLQSGLVELFSPAFLEAKAALREAPTFIQTYRVGGYNERYGDVSVVMDLLIHDLGNVLNLTGYTLPVAVEVIGSSSVSKKTDEVDVALLFSSGLQVGMHADRISAAPIRYTDIIGTDQQLHIDYLHGKTRDTLTPQLENFVDAIESGAASRTDEELAVLKLALYIDALAAESCAPAEEATA